MPAHLIPSVFSLSPKEIQDDGGGRLMEGLSHPCPLVLPLFLCAACPVLLACPVAARLLCVGLLLWLICTLLQALREGGLSDKREHYAGRGFLPSEAQPPEVSWTSLLSSRMPLRAQGALGMPGDQKYLGHSAVALQPICGVSRVAWQLGRGFGVGPYCQPSSCCELGQRASRSSLVFPTMK